MEEIYQWGWMIPMSIGLFSAAKVVLQYLQGRQADHSSGTDPAPQARTAAPRESRSETGPMVYFANDRHGQTDKEYRFNYKKVNGSWRAYILRMPSLGSREASGVVTHRMFDNGRPYVCWDSPVNTLKDMQTISKVWADNLQEYIATGKRFG